MGKVNISLETDNSKPHLFKPYVEVEWDCNFIPKVGEFLNIEDFEEMKFTDEELDIVSDCIFFVESIYWGRREGVIVIDIFLRSAE